MTGKQLDLFPDYDAAVIADVEAKLPNEKWLYPKDVARVLEFRNVQTVYDLMDSGDFYSMNFGAGDVKEFRKIFRQSVIDWFKRRQGR